MRLLLTIAALVAAFGVTTTQPAQAGTLTQQMKHAPKPNRDQVSRSRELPQTVVIRINRVTGQMEVAQVKQRLGKAPINVQFFDQEGLFKPVNLAQPLSPNYVDGANWLFYFMDGLWNYPTYSYYDYDYTYGNYYSYPYDNYDYYYFGWPFSLEF